MQFALVADFGKLYLTKLDISNYYNVVLFSKFLTMTTTAGIYIDKLSASDLVFTEAHR